MKIIIWKKWIEIKKTKLKMILFALFPTMLFVVYRVGFRVDIVLFVKMIFIIAGCFSYLFFYTVDDIACASLYSIVGIKPRESWLGNIVFSVMTGSGATMLTVIPVLVFTKTALDIPDVFVIMLSPLIVVMLVGLNTIHYMTNSFKAMVIGSVFALINMALVVVPVLLSEKYVRIEKYFDLGIVFLAIVSIVVVLMIYRKVRTDSIEKLVENSKIYIEGYDKNFFPED